MMIIDQVQFQILEGWSDYNQVQSSMEDDFLEISTRS